MGVSSWMRVAKRQRHNREVEAMQTSHQHELDMQSATLHQERKQLHKVETDFAHLRSEIQRYEQDSAALRAHYGLPQAVEHCCVVRSHRCRSFPEDAIRDRSCCHSRDVSVCLPRSRNISDRNGADLELLRHSLCLLDDRRRSDLMLMVPGMQRVVDRMILVPASVPKYDCGKNAISQPPLSGRCTSVGSTAPCESLTGSSDDSEPGSPTCFAEECKAVGQQASPDCCGNGILPKSSTASVSSTCGQVVGAGRGEGRSAELHQQKLGAPE